MVRIFPMGMLIPIRRRVPQQRLEPAFANLDFLGGISVQQAALCRGLEGRQVPVVGQVQRLGYDLQSNVEEVGGRGAKLGC